MRICTNVARERVFEMANKRELRQDLLEWCERNKKGRVLKKVDVMAYTGFGRSYVDNLLNGLPRVGSKVTYFYADVADRLIDGIERR